jgi:signal peptidase I
MNPLKTEIPVEDAAQHEQPPALPPAARASARGSWITSIQSLSLTVVIAVFVITFLVQAFQIPSESMENTLLIGDYLLVDKVHYSDGGAWGKVLPYGEIGRGDIIVFHYPLNPSQHFVKRVIGLPGDRVRMASKRVWVNGQLLDDRGYAVHQANYVYFRDNFPQRAGVIPGQIDAQWWLDLDRNVRNGELTVPANSYFVLGDNRDDSEDSRYWGFVPRGNVVGRPLLIYFSLERQHPATSARTADGKLLTLAETTARFWDAIRWKRMMRLVR